MKNNFCVIMAGGLGTRFWPMSKSSNPKQFLDILGVGKSLLQQTYDRFLKICPPENIFIVTHESYKNLINDQLPNVSDGNILYEPIRKNTAPCVAYACYKIAQINKQANIVIAPSDHLILKENVFTRAIKSCYQKAKSEDCLLTLGIKPTRPDTGYGYIQYKKSDIEEEDWRIKKVKTFTEKPDIDMAKFFLQSGDFLWNAGIFIWNVNSIIKAFKKYVPEMHDLFSSIEKKYNTSEEYQSIKTIYAECKNISIDYAVLEKADNVYVRESIIGWSDLGTWGSLYTHIAKDTTNNAIVGKNVMVYNSKNCIVNVPKDKLVVIQGLSNYIVVDTDDTLLICKKEEEQSIKTIVNDVKVTKGDKYV